MLAGFAGVGNDRMRTPSRSSRVLALIGWIVLCPDCCDYLGGRPTAVLWRGKSPVKCGAIAAIFSCRCHHAATLAPTNMLRESGSLCP